MEKVTKIGKYKKVRRPHKNAPYIFLFIIIFIYMAYSAFLFAIKPHGITKERVFVDKMEDVIYAEGVLIRNEKVVPSPSTGEVKYYFQQNEKVKPNDLIVSISKGIVTEKKLEKLNAVDDEILKVQTRRSDIFTHKEEIKNLNTLMNYNFKMFYTKNFYASDFEAVSDLKKDITEYFKEKKNILSSEVNESISSLSTSRDVITNEIDANTANLYSPFGGILSFSVDGYENKFSFDTLNTITPDDILKLKSKPKIRADEFIKANEPVFKVVYNFEWYTAINVNSSKVNNYKVGDRKKVRIYGVETTEIVGEIFKIEKNKNKTFIIFKFVSNLDNILDYRKVKLEILENSFEGFKIPKKAIIEKAYLKIPNECIIDSQKVKGVLKSIDKLESFTPIHIIFSDEKYSYVENNFDNLKIGDNLIIRDSFTNKVVTLNAVETVKGIYVVNTNYATFKRLDVVMEKEDYVLAKTDSVNSIKLYDKFISDSSKVKDGDFIE